ncbi:RES domain-containing protein (plasmid) [Rubrobacter tropicus]|uniref:RES domain-containing protein n=1 Tax=Rubrobacter tropicus TaxID=2653851 RepID=A0A6G8QG33_9ACTN|nr:RES family NAD+ phosphorylase [Rubrobacter tropicus]QIN85430.1 RES domain-containing protein [Rubrobacter tropicus]
MPLDDELPIRPVGGPWQRFHGAGFGSVYFGRKKKYRFDDPNGEYGVLYAGADEYGAFVETFLRNPELRLVDRTEIRARRLAELEIARRMRLVDLTGPGLQQAGIDPERVTGDYSLSQPLSREIYEHPATPDGILYRVKYDPSRIGVALFERRRTKNAVVPEDRGCLLDPHNDQLLADLLQEYHKYI